MNGRLHLELLTKGSHDIFSQLMALDETQIAVELDMGRGEMVLRSIVMDNQVMDTINTRTLKDRILDLLVQLCIRCRP